jgi:hypothetical protein
MGVYRPMTVAGQMHSAIGSTPALLHIGSMSPTRLSLSMVASLQCVAGAETSGTAGAMEG